MVGTQLLAGWQWDPETDRLTLSGPVEGLSELPVTAASDDLLARVAPGQRSAVTGVLLAAAEGTDLGTAFAVQFSTVGPRAATIRLLGHPAVLDGHRQVVGMVEDVTAARAARAQEVRSSRLASLARLAAGVAHDFNNHLTVISMRADLLGGALESEHIDPVHFEEDLAAIAGASVAAAALTRRLTVFAGSGGGPLSDVDFAAVVAGLRPRLAGARGGPIAVDYLIEDCPAVRCDRGQAEQVVTNLVLNAREAVARAMNRDGRQPRVSVTIRPVGDPADIAARSARAVERTPTRQPPPGWVLVEVADNGIGMSADVREKAFDPFFTTADAGRGSGLGLSVVFGVVEHLGGTLEIESEVEVGTTIRIALPAISAGRPVRREVPTPAPRVLVVDDDAAVVAITSRILGTQGFQVTTAASGEEALELLRSASPFAIVVSDVVMGRMTGMVLAQHVARDWPGVPMLLVTGYAPPADLVANPLLELVTKPLTGAALVAAVQMLLDRAALALDATPTP